MNAELKKQIKEHISSIESAKEIYELFRLLNYPEEYLFDETYKRKKQEFGFRSTEIDRILQIYQVMLIEDTIPVFLIETKTLSQSFIRNVTEKFDRHYRQFLLIFAVPEDDYSNILFVLPAREKVEGKYKLKLIRLNVNKEEIIERNEHYTVINILSRTHYKDENYRELWKKWLESFSVEKVTEEFFEDYQNVFFDLREQIKDQEIPQREAHEFTLQLLNRIMFTHFISKKKWLKYPNFMKWYWDEYKKLGKFGSDEFYEKWLKELFFKAFNNRQDQIEGLPEEVKEVLLGFPYLNGGLFTENKNDKLDIKISDQTFKRIFEFFEKYNFTIKEDAPFDVEVAVDPQMIGYVYESLSNVAEEIYDRNDMGIFYTPRVEVDFMCRRSLVEYLSKKLPEVPKEQFYHFVFDLPEEKRKSEKYFTKEDLWYDLRDALDDLSVVDPACGSGAFLVGMLIVLDELYRIIYKHTEDEMTDFERKFRIIQYSLYGVDVMPWAIHAAELRLWLQLIIETELKDQELKKAPLLPNLDLNLRIGDSIVQEIGGVNINIRTGRLPSKIKKRLEDLKEQKRLYYENSRSARLKRSEDFQKEEIRIFEDIIHHEIKELERKLEFKTRDSKPKQVTLKGEVKEESYKLTKKEIREIEDEIKRLTRIKEVLYEPEKKPFIWEIDFVEKIFDAKGGDAKGGFDIVIGNPPYVRQEDISPPNKLKSEITGESKTKYKDALSKSIQERLPLVNEIIDKKRTKKIAGKSDYYIYFYFLGLSLLNRDGVFCFISSNAWLDVDYGKELREFLCKYTKIISIYDNPKKSFAHAEINTTITMLSAPLTMNDGFKFNTRWPGLQKTAKFVMFKKPLEEVVNSQNLIEIDALKVNTNGGYLPVLVKNILNNNYYRCFPITQEDLLEEGWDYKGESSQKFKNGRYNGYNWGGKFLRAPDIFYKILEKGNFLKLGEIADAKFGMKTGANGFFYLKPIGKNVEEVLEISKKNPDALIKVKNKDRDKYMWEGYIEAKYLKPLIKSPKEIKGVFINPKYLDYLAFVCDEPKSELKGTNALEYIKWGEKHKLQERSTCKQRKLWYSLPKLPKPDILFNQVFGEKFQFPLNNTNFIIDHSFNYIICPENTENLVLLLNSVINFLIVEIIGRTNLGDGGLQTYINEVKSLFILDPSFLDKSNSIKILEEYDKIQGSSKIYDEIGIDYDKEIKKQTPNPTRKRRLIDTIIFDELGLTEEERNEVYLSVCELVKQRIEKSKSLKKKK